jgi:hypothetical protein
MIKNYFTLVIVFLFISLTTNAQTTAIPDPNFEQALIDLGIDSDGVINGEVLTEDIAEIGSLDVSQKNISDLTGIGGFNYLKNLNVSHNNLTSLADLKLPMHWSGGPYPTLNASYNNLSGEFTEGGFNILNLSNNNFTLININSMNIEQIDVSNNDLTSFSLIVNNDGSNWSDDWFIKIDNNSNLVEIDIEALALENLYSLNIDNNPDLERLILKGNISISKIENQSKLTFIELREIEDIQIINNSVKILNIGRLDEENNSDYLVSGNDNLEEINFSEVDFNLLFNSLIILNNNSLKTLEVASSCRTLSINENDLLTNLDLNFYWSEEITIMDNISLDAISLDVQEVRTKLAIINNSAVKNLLFGYDYPLKYESVQIYNNSALFKINFRSGNEGTITSLEVINNESLSSIQMSDVGPITCNKIKVNDNYNLTKLSLYGSMNIDLSNNMINDLELGYENQALIDLSKNDLKNIPDRLFNTIKELNLSDNSFSELAFSNIDNSSIKIQKLIVDNSPNLTVLDTRDQKTLSQESVIELSAQNNPMLKCIQVIDEQKANSGASPYDTWIKDDFTIYREESCRTYVEISTDKTQILENGEKAIITASLNYANPFDNVVVNFMVSGTAPSSNYDLSSTQIVIPAGELSEFVTLTGKEDQMETDKTVIFEIASLENAEEETPQKVTVTIIHVNDPPTDINLLFDAFEENVEFDELTKIIVDDIDDTTHDITLVEGDGSDDNDNFFVVGDMLHTKIIFDYEDQKEHFIRLKAEDSGGLSIEKAFVITVIDENELILTGVVTNNYCEEGDVSSIITTVSGQYTPPLSYQWMSGETTPDLYGKPNGIYTLTVTDAVGGFARKDFTITSEPVYADMSICYVTSDDENQDNNRIYFNNTGAYNIDQIVILREGIVSGLYDVIGAVNPDQPSFLDTTSDNQVVSYNYKVQVTDKCGGISESSASHKTVLLQANKAADGSINLTWSAYEGLNYGTYDIYRKENSDDDFQLLTSLSSANLSYNDTEANSNTKSYSYYIGITLNETCDFTVPDQSNKLMLAGEQIKSNTKFIGSTLGVDDEELSQSVKIYPNPVGNFLTIESPLLELTKVEIFSLLGATLKVEKNDFESIYMEDLSKGIYMIKIQSEFGTTVKKLIKE